MSEALTQEQLDLANDLIATAIAGVLNVDSMTCGWLAGTLGNAVGRVDDIIWTDMVLNAAKPCGTPGCDCHKNTKRLFDTLDNLRRWRRRLEKSGNLRTLSFAP